MIKLDWRHTYAISLGILLGAIIAILFDLHSFGFSFLVIGAIGMIISSMWKSKIWDIFRKAIVPLLVLSVLMAIPTASAQTILTDTIIPVADSAPLQWANMGCASSFECVDETPHDADFTHLLGNPGVGVTLESVLKMDSWVPRGSLLAISDVTIFIWARQDGGGISSFVIDIRTEEITCLSFALILSTNYVNISLSLPDCPGFFLWNKERINALFVGILCIDDGAPPDEADCIVTNIGAVITYTVIEAVRSDLDRIFLLVLFFFLVIAGVMFTPFLIVSGIMGILFALGSMPDFVLAMIWLSVGLILIFIGALMTLEELS